MRIFKIRNLWLIALLSFFGCGGETPSISVQPSEEVFEQEGEEVVAKMDILWVIDNSGSMDNFQQQLDQNALTFIENFSEKNYDFQIAVTVTDGWMDLDFNNYVSNGGPSFGNSDRSRFKSANDGSTRILTPNTPNLITKFQEMVKVGITGNGDERALSSLEASVINPDNTSFFREDAHLAVILVSDEEDLSWRSGCPVWYDQNPCQYVNRSPFEDGYVKPQFAQELETVNYYHNFLTQNSSSIYGYSLHNMAVLDDGLIVGEDRFGNPADCRTAQLEGDADQYARFFGERTSELANLSEGTVSSLCSDFANSLEDIAQTIIERTTEFYLDDVPPNPNDIFVAIKNPGESEFNVIPQNSQNGWSYNASANSVVFHGDAIPAQGAQVSIVFDRDTF